jgi:hexosaminidase
MRHQNIPSSYYKRTDYYKRTEVVPSPVRVKNRGVLWLALIVCGMVLAFLSLLPFHLFAPINFFANTYPNVVPIMREWNGDAGSFVLGSSSQIVLDSANASQLQDTATIFQQDLTLVTGWTPPIVSSAKPGTSNFFLTLQTQDSGLGNEGYLLDVGDAVTINARTVNGVFYGTRSVLQILNADSDHSNIPKGFGRDYPAYHERGFMLDVGRKFVPLNVLEDYVRLMSWYKFNDFQLHFNDNALDGGKNSDWQHQYAAFRLSSPDFPGLAASDGSYTEQQIRELEQFAQQHAMTITPEIDTPAHALALTQYDPKLASPTSSKEFLNLDDPATYTFVDSLWKTFLPWFTTSQVNMGMDEYDPNAADKYRRYMNYLDNFLRQQGKTARMWGSLSEIQSNVQVNTNIVIEDWNNAWANPVDMVNQGFHIINANDVLLYIVPHAGYYHDYLDTRTIYDHWEPYIFSLDNQDLNLSPNDPHLLGGMFAVWNDKFDITSVDDISQRIEPAMPVIGEKMWSGTVSNIDYSQFEKVVQQIGPAPSTHLP